MDNPLQAAQQAAAAAASAAQNAASTAQTAAQNAAASAQQAAGAAQTAAQNAAASAQQAVQNATAAAQQSAQNATIAAQQAAASAQDAAQNAAATAQEAAQNATAAAQEAAASAQEAAQNAVASAQETAQNAAASAQESAQNAATAAQAAAASAQEAAQNAASAAQETGQQAAEAAQQAAEEAAGAAQEAAAAAQEAAQQAGQSAQEATTAASEMAQNATAAAQEAAAPAVAAAQAAAAEAGAAAQEAAGAAQEAAAGAAESAQETAAAAAEGAQGAASDLAAPAASVVPAAVNPVTKKDVLISQFFLKIGGKAVPQPEMEELMRDVIEIVVDDNLHLPDMFTIHLHDKSLKWIDSPLLGIGETVEIAAKAPTEQGEGAEKEQTLIKGEITALEPDFTSLGEPTLLVRGYDRAHRLHRGRKSRSYLKAKDSEIAQKIAQEVGLRFQIDATSTIYEYIFQNNQTNWEFLLERAHRIGYQLYVEDMTLHFRKGNSNQGQGPELEWGANLRTFRPRLTVVHQADEVIVRGWDPKAKQAIVGRASGGELIPAVGVGKSGGQLAKEIFRDSAQAVVVDEFISTQDEAQLLAQTIWDEISGDFIQADGVCMGDPRLQAGRMVQITAVGDRFKGTYFVTSAVHTYNVETGYETILNISGRRPNTFSFLLSSQNGNDHHIYGPVVGLVTNNRDPEGMGRVKVKFPWLSDKEESTWARLVSPMAGDGRGLFYLPEVNDEVLVAFEHNDIHRPYILGALWGKDKPPLSVNEAVSSDKVNKRIIKSRSGHRIILDDTSGQEKIEIIDKSGNNSVVINTATNSVTVQAGGSQKVTLDGQGQSIQMQGGGRMVTLRGGQVQIT